MPFQFPKRNPISWLRLSPIGPLDAPYTFLGRKGISRWQSRNLVPCDQQWMSPLDVDGLPSAVLSHGDLQGQRATLPHCSDSRGAVSSPSPLD
jgi:hypothetical protein